ncbi:MAG: DinB family protein [Leadbetterella sp.]
MINYHLTVLQNIDSLCRLLDQDKYTAKLEVLSTSTLGQHIRHIIEFYVCLINGLDERSVNYDKRERNLMLETLPDYAVALIQDIKSTLIQTPIDTELVIEQEYNGVVFNLKSSFARELHYMAEHTVHHFALIKIGVENSFPDIILPKNFGIADSTIKHREECVS